LSASTPIAAITMPGVQNPHCRPCSSRNAACIGCISPSGPASPSSVVTWPPSVCAASTVQLFTLSPSTMTVHAPHEVESQPMLVALSPQTSRR
jgi:hypothetical protein